jgi:hypothetical protein
VQVKHPASGQLLRFIRMQSWTFNTKKALAEKGVISKDRFTPSPPAVKQNTVRFHMTLYAWLDDFISWIFSMFRQTSGTVDDPYGTVDPIAYARFC